MLPPVQVVTWKPTQTQVVVLHPVTKFEVRRASRTEDVTDSRSRR